METNNSCSLQIARLRREKGVTQEEVARRLGVTFQAVSKWETGAAFPDIALLPAIAAYFGTTVDAVLGYDSAAAESPAALYAAIKGTLERLPPDRLYRDIWNLSCLLHEAAVTGGWKGHMPWPVRNRLEDDGYDGWGFSANLEPKGFTMMTKGFTAFGLMEQLELPAQGRCGRIASLYRRLSDSNVLRVLLVVLDKQKGREDPAVMALEELAEGAGLGPEDCRVAIEKLTDCGWMEESDGGKRCFCLAHHMEAVLLPLLVIAGTFSNSTI